MLLWSFEGAAARITCCGLSTISAVIASGVHLFPFRTEKLSPTAPMVLGAQAPGRVGRRRITSGGPRERPSFPLDLQDGARPPDPSWRTSSLAPWRDDDVRIVAACNDPEIVRWTTFRRRTPRMMPVRPGLHDGWGGAAPCRRRAGDGELAAAITLWVHGKVGELGYWAAPAIRGRGYVPRAVRLLCDWAIRRARAAATAARHVSRQPGVRARGGEERLHARRRAAFLARAARRPPRRDDVVAPTRRARVEPRPAARAAGG